MAKYVKKAIPVEVWQCTYENYIDNKSWPDFIHQALESGRVSKLECDHVNKIVTGVISTLEGKLFIENNAYIIFGVKGEIYPCNKEIFEESYEMWNGI